MENHLIQFNWPFELNGVLAYSETSKMREVIDRPGIPHVLEHLYHRNMNTFLKREKGSAPYISNGRTDDTTFSVYLITNKDDPVAHQTSSHLHRLFKKPMDHITEEDFETERNIILHEINERNSIAYKLKDFLVERLIKPDYRYKSIMGTHDDIATLPWEKVQASLEHVGGSYRMLSCENTSVADTGDSLQDPFSTRWPNMKVDFYADKLKFGRFNVLTFCFMVPDDNVVSYIQMGLIEYALKNSKNFRINDLIRDHYKISYATHVFRVNCHGKIMLSMFALSQDEIPSSVLHDLKARIKDPANFSFEDLIYCADLMSTETKFYRSCADIISNLGTSIARYGRGTVEYLVNYPDIRPILNFLPTATLVEVGP